MIDGHYQALKHPSENGAVSNKYRYRHLLVAVILPVVVSVGALFVVPQFLELFRGFNAELPLGTWHARVGSYLSLVGSLTNFRLCNVVGLKERGVEPSLYNAFWCCIRYRLICIWCLGMLCANSQSCGCCLMRCGLTMHSTRLRNRLFAQTKLSCRNGLMRR